jgi:hypothetical protein
VIKVQIEGRGCGISRGNIGDVQLHKSRSSFLRQKQHHTWGSLSRAYWLACRTLISGFGFFELFVFELIVIAIVIVLWELMKRDKRTRGRRALRCGAESEVVKANGQSR